MLLDGVLYRGSLSRDVYITTNFSADDGCPRGNACHESDTGGDIESIPPVETSGQIATKLTVCANWT